MTGTSLDGLDAALVRIAGSGLAMRADPAGLISLPLGALTQRLLPLVEGGEARPIDFMRCGRQLGQLHATAVAQLCAEHLPREAQLDLVAAHGQTIWHAPPDPGEPRPAAADDGLGLSWQLLGPWPMVRHLGVPVVYDLRQADLITGGQGAPITPLADYVLYGDRADMVVNLGGICNVTKLHPKVDGMDVCPCNLLIDQVVRILYRQVNFDQDGQLAAQGKPDPHLFADLMADLPRGRSLGRQDVLCGRNVETLVLRARRNRRPSDIIASAVAAVAQQVADTIGRYPAQVAVVAGGGAHNPVLVKMIRDRCQPTRLLLSDEVGIPIQSREAIAMAVLGALSQDKVVITRSRDACAQNPPRAGAWVYP